MELKNYFAQNAAGDVLPDAVAYLYEPGTTTLVAGLQNAAGQPIGNPVAADDKGLLQFAAPNGTYDLRVTAPGREYTLRIQCNDVTDSLAAAEAAAASAAASRIVAEDAAELAGLVAFFPTRADAAAAIWDIPAGQVVRVLADETRSGRSTWYRSNSHAGAALVLDFVTGEYAVSEDPLTFIKSDDLRLVTVPAAATSNGLVGELAIDSTHLYVAVGINTWRRVALSTF
ncbi:hypothetical protein [Stutzerimonas xanthomarina]|uniref:hypothetical protein n=1 Tax=Stutzerimonas xanthomarina TaxID=271420 RepID=UPI003AA99DA7